MDSPCSVCGKDVKVNQTAIVCPFCNFLSHTRCNALTKKEYRTHQQNTDEPFCCKTCCANFPFNNINNIEFEFFLKYENKNNLDDLNINIQTPSSPKSIITYKINNLLCKIRSETEISEDNDDNETTNRPFSCTYY